MKFPYSASTHLVQKCGSPLRERCTDKIGVGTQTEEESLTTILFSMMYCGSEDDDSTFYGSVSSFDESDSDGCSMGDLPLRRQLDPFFQQVATAPLGIHDTGHQDTPHPRRTGLFATQELQQQAPDWSIEFHYQHGHLHIRLWESIGSACMNLLPNEIEFSLFPLIEEPSYRLFAVHDVDGRVYHLGSRDIIPFVSMILHHVPWMVREVDNPTVFKNTVWKPSERVGSARKVLVRQRFCEYSYGHLPVSRLEYQE